MAYNDLQEHIASFEVVCRSQFLTIFLLSRLSSLLTCVTHCLRCQYQIRKKLFLSNLPTILSKKQRKINVKKTYTSTSKCKVEDAECQSMIEFNVYATIEEISLKSNEAETKKLVQKIGDNSATWWLKIRFGRL